MRRFFSKLLSCVLVAAISMSLVVFGIAEQTQSTDGSLTVVFNGNGGTPSTESVEVAVGEKIGTLPTATRTGYTFDGWFTSLDGGTKLTSSTPVTGNITCYAHWTAVKIIIHFYSPQLIFSNGTRFIDVEETYDQPWVFPTFASADDYPINKKQRFTGWWTDIMVGSGKEFKPGDIFRITNDSYTVNATSSYAMYDFYYDANGGSFSPSNTVARQDSYPDEKFILPAADPMRDGYYFDGWYTAKQNGTKITVTVKVSDVIDSISKVDGKKMIYAHWGANSYIVMFDPQGGVMEPGISTVETYAKYGEKWGTIATSNQSYSKEGFVLAGWSRNKEGTQIIKADDVVGNYDDDGYVKLYAVWKNAVTVTFNANGGTPGTQSVQVAVGEKIGTLPTVTQTDYVFNNWYTDSWSGSKITQDTVVTQDVTYYAHWLPLKNVIHFSSSQLIFSNGTRFMEVEQTYGQPWVFPTFASPDEYPINKRQKFTGWWSGSMVGMGQEIKPGDLCYVTNDTYTVYATSSYALYAFYYDANGGLYERDNTVFREDSYPDETFILPEVAPTREGYYFDGWYTAPQDGTHITAAAKVSDVIDSISVIDNERMIYAHWKANSYIVMFDPQGGVMEPDISTVETYAKYGEKWGTIATSNQSYSKEGFFLAGWSLNKEGTQIIKADDVVGNYDADGYVKLYAIWQPDTYSVILTGENYRVLRGYWADEQTETLVFYTSKNDGPLSNGDLVITVTPQFYTGKTPTVMSVKVNYKAEDATYDGKPCTKVTVPCTAQASGITRVTVDIKGNKAYCDLAVPGDGDMNTLVNAQDITVLLLYINHGKDYETMPEEGKEPYTYEMFNLDENAYLNAQDVTLLLQMINRVLKIEPQKVPDSN